MTVREIASIAGVSAATVSRFMRNAASVNPESRQRLEKVMTGGVYASRRKGRAPCVAVLAPHLRLQFYQCALRELMENAPSAGLRLVILPAQSEADTGWADMLDMLSPTAVISLLTSLDPPTARWLAAHPHVRAAVLADKSSIEGACTVHIDDLAAAYEGTQYLLNLGHRRICFFSNVPHGISTSFQRLTGSQKAMSERGLPFAENVRYGALTYDMGYALAQALARDERGQYTAIFAYSDEMAVGAIMALRDGGLRVPEDISVLGIDDLPIATYIRPQLTTLHQPLGDMVRCILSLLSQEDSSGRAVALPHRLIKRGTCRAIAEDEQ